MNLGYARVSSTEQDLSVQIEKLELLGCENIYFEKVSGKQRNNREQLQACIDFSREGDVIHVTKLDSLARNTLDALSIADQLESKGVGLILHDIASIDINSPVGRMIYTTISAVATMERQRIAERCAEGRAKAKVEGRPLGKQKNEELHNNIKQLFKNGINKAQIAKQLNCGRATVYRALSL